MDHGNCKKCRRPLIREYRMLIGLAEPEMPLGRSRLKYQTTYACPELQKPFRWIANSHTSVTVTEYD